MQRFRVSLTLATLALLLSPLAWSQTLSAQTLASNQSAPDQSLAKAEDLFVNAGLTLEPHAVLKRTGAGVTAFILDTGIREDHSEFSGRVLPGFSVINDGKGTTDCNGHGTHVAGIVGGRLYGVAKQVMLVPVRVMDCAGVGTVSGLITALEWVGNTKQRPAVANVSMGGIASSALNAAVAALVAKGVTVVVAAGNKGVDACKASPASAPSVISVGATNKEGALAPYSNFGPCVSIFAAGSEVVSAWHTSDSATKTLSGTSMASPSVAGLAALALETVPEASPLEVANFLVDHARHSRFAESAIHAPTGLLAWMSSALAGPADTQTLALKAMATLSAAPGPRTR
jgi:subtilisin family serine protease